MLAHRTGVGHFQPFTSDRYRVRSASAMTELLLGSECDDDLFYRLVAEVQAMGGSIVDREWAVGGPQEVTLYEISLPGADLVATAQSGVGLSLRGEPALVEALADRVAPNRRA